MTEVAEPEFRFSRNQVVKNVVGPGSYTPRYRNTSTVAPSSSFGKSSRFVGSSKQYISAHHNSDSLCTASPGPKYYPRPGNLTSRSAPAYSLGATIPTIDAKDAAIASGMSNGGPAAYTPRIHISKPQSARAAFGKSERFPTTEPYISKAHMKRVNQVGKPAPNHYMPRKEFSEDKAPSYSFGPQVPLKGRHAMRTNRTSFLTHSVRGGLARAATLECGLGPSDYSPRITATTRRHAQTAFGKSSRFKNSNAEYISALHCVATMGQSSPGPKYYNTLSDVQHQVMSSTPRGAGLQWLP